MITPACNTVVSIPDVSRISPTLVRDRRCRDSVAPDGRMQPAQINQPPHAGATSGSDDIVRGAFLV
jgi:hypothetical protein